MCTIPDGYIVAIKEIGIFAASLLLVIPIGVIFELAHVTSFPEIDSYESIIYWLPYNLSCIIIPQLILRKWIWKNKN